MPESRKLPEKPSEKLPLEVQAAIITASGAVTAALARGLVGSNAHNEADTVINSYIGKVISAFTMHAKNFN